MTHEPTPQPKPHPRVHKTPPSHTHTHPNQPPQIADKQPGVGGGLAGNLLTDKPLRTLLSKVRTDNVTQLCPRFFGGGHYTPTTSRLSVCNQQLSDLSVSFQWC